MQTILQFRTLQYSIDRKEPSGYLISLGVSSPLCFEKAIEECRLGVRGRWFQSLGFIKGLKFQSFVFISRTHTLKPGFQDQLYKSILCVLLPVHIYRKQTSLTGD
jgi:hypothetical protein